MCIRDRIHLDEAGGVVPLGHLDLLAGRALAAAQAADPGVELALRAAQRELDAWICGLRSGQGATRQKVEVAEWDDAAGLVKMNPLAAWDEARVWSYVRAHDAVSYTHL